MPAFCGCHSGICRPTKTLPLQGSACRPALRRFSEWTWLSALLPFGDLDENFKQRFCQIITDFLAQLAHYPGHLDERLCVLSGESFQMDGRVWENGQKTVWKNHWPALPSANLIVFLVVVIWHILAWKPVIWHV